MSFRHLHGHAIPDVPSCVDLADDPVEVIRGWNEAEGLEVDAHTSTPLWHGERLDVAYALDVRHPLARSG